ncbi:MAG: enolase C-terminal domain-like protein [Chloroflexota bacterium]
MNPLEIQAADVYVVGPDVERFRFSSDMGAVFETLTIVKITTADGGTSIGGMTLFSENDFDTSLGESLRSLLPAIIGRSAKDPSAITQHLIGRYNSMSPKPQGVIDIALWDRLAKARQEPLYKTLGGTRSRMPAYASLPLSDTVDGYLAAIRLMADEHQFDTFKLHGWCELAPDLELINRLLDTFGNKTFRFILDLEERYLLKDAITIAKALESLSCPWIEAPLPDTDLDGYRQLRSATTIPIIPAGNTLESMGLVRLGVAANAWDGIRVDGTYAGGISQVKAIIEYGESQGLPTELQAWGYTLSQATNLHLSLASPKTRFFELPVPYGPHEACALNPIRAKNGWVSAPEGFGLGIDVDWVAVEQDLLLHYRIA